MGHLSQGCFLVDSYENITAQIFTYELRQGIIVSYLYYRYLKNISTCYNRDWHLASMYQAEEYSARFTLLGYRVRKYKPVADFIHLYEQSEDLN